MTRPLKLLLIADSDSQLLAFEALCRCQTARSVEFTINVIPMEGTPQHILKRINNLGTLWRQNLGRINLVRVPIICCQPRIEHDR